MQTEGTYIAEVMKLMVISTK